MVYKMPTKTRAQLYNDIAEAVDELRRQDEVHKEESKSINSLEVVNYSH